MRRTPSVRIHCSGIPATVLVLLFVVGIATAKAEGVPPNLASMARDLFSQGSADLNEVTGDPRQDAVLLRARKILKEAGIRHWARDEVRADDNNELPRSYKMTVGDNDDQLDINWEPDISRFEIRIGANETKEGAGDRFDLWLNGDVLSTPEAGGNGAVLSVRLREPAITVLAVEDLRRLQGEIFGGWRSDDGAVWEISAGGGGRGEIPSEHPEDRIAELERQIEKIRSDRVFRWRNTETGEVVLQEKFKKLKEPFVYDREVLHHPDGEAEIARLKEMREEIRAANKPLPVAEHDPIGMKKMRTSGRAQSLHIRVTDENGYSWTYDEAVLLDGRITASRTLRNLNDSPRLPEKVVRQAIASFSPPEWVELDVRVRETTEVSLHGQLWRMKVTYSGDDLTVKSVHTPWSRSLDLRRASTQVASGAAKEARP